MSKPPSLADQINTRVSCEDLAYKLGMQRPGERGNWRSPHHPDKSPSVQIYAKDGRSFFKDYSTDEGGGPVDLYMWFHVCDFTTAVRELAQMYGIERERPATGAAAGQQRERSKIEWIADNCTGALKADGHRQALFAYLQGRGITEAAIKHAIARGTLGLNTYTNPQFAAGEINHGGPAVATIVRHPDTLAVTAVDMRYLDPSLNGGVKTQSQGEKMGHPWCSDWRRLKDARTVVVVESAINALTVDACALPRTAALAIRGTGNAALIDWRLLQGKQVVLCLDNDPPAEHGPKKGYCPGLSAAWTIHEALVALDIPALMVDQDDWKDDEEEPINDLNDILQAWGIDRTAAALKKLEQWLIPGMPGKEHASKPRIFLPSHDYQTYWRYRVRPDFTFYVDKVDTTDDGEEKLSMVNVAGFRVAGISRVRIASVTSMMTGDKDTAPNTVYAVSVQVPRQSESLLRRVVQDEQLHNVEHWKKLGPIFSPSSFLRMVNILERAADIGARDAANFVGLVWRNGRLLVNEGPDCYFQDPRQQCPYHALVFPSSQRQDARQVVEAYQATFRSNAASILLVWALGAHLKAFLGFWPHFVMQAEKGSGKSTVIKRLERSIGMTMFSGQSLQTEFRILTSISCTSHPVGWEEISARKQELIDKAVAQLQECYQYAHTRRGADLLDFVLSAPVLLAGEDVPVKSLTGKLVRNRLTKADRGAPLADDLPVFPVRQWLQWLADTPKARVLDLHRQCITQMQASCSAARDDAGAERMLSNYGAVRAAWVLLCEFADIDQGSGNFLSDLTAEMNGHIKETEGERQPWVWIMDVLLSEISRGTFRYPHEFGETEDGEAFLAVRTSHVMDHIAREPSLRQTWDGLTVKSDRVFKGQLRAANVLAHEDIERTINKQRVAHLVGISLPALELYGLSASRPANPEPAH